MLNKKILSLALSGSLLLAGNSYAADAINSNYDLEINAAVQKAENEAQTQFNNATRRDTVPLWSDKVQAENAIIQLEVKKTLANNFRGTASLQNPIIRAKLLEILNKSIILESDLAELQSLVNQEKAKLDVQSATRPVNAPSSSNLNDPALRAVNAPASNLN